MLIKRSSQCLYKRTLMLNENIGELDWILENLILHLDVVGGLEASLLAELLDAVDDFAGEAGGLEVGVELAVEDGEHVLVGVCFEEFGGGGGGDAFGDDEVAGFEGDAVDDHGAVLEVGFALLGGDGGERLLDAADIFAELLAEDGPVCGDGVGDVVGGFVRGELELVDVELGLDVVLERENVIKVLLVSVDDDESLERGLETDGTALTGETSKLNDLLHARDLALNIVVQELGTDRWEWKEMDGSGILWKHLLWNVLLESVVDVLSNVWGEWSQCPDKDKENLKEGVQSVEGILDSELSLQTLAVEANVPVGDVVNHLEDTRNDSVEAVSLHLSINVGQETLAVGKNPSIHDILASGMLESEDEVDISNLLEQWDLLIQELERVPQWQQNLCDNLLDTSFLELELFGTDNWGVDEVQTQWISTILFKDQVWIWVVLETLGHLLSILSKDNAVDDAVLEWSSSEQVGSEDDKGIEPSSRLIDTLGDEIGWESFVKLLLVLKWIVHGSVWHTEKELAQSKPPTHTTLLTFQTQTNSQRPHQLF